jgi:hypothetical protein
LFSFSCLLALCVDALGLGVLGKTAFSGFWVRVAVSFHYCLLLCLGSSCLCFHLFIACFDCQLVSYIYFPVTLEDRFYLKLGSSQVVPPSVSPLHDEEK